MTILPLFGKIGSDIGSRKSISTKFKKRRFYCFSKLLAVIWIGSDFGTIKYIF